MIRFLRSSLIAALLLCCTLPLFAQTGDEHLQLQLLSEQSQVKPGSTATLGLLFKMAPHWHIYWVNPGDSGEAPSAKWELPQGATVGEIQWPVPKRFPLSTLLDYGYEDTVLLAVPLKIPATATGKLPIKAHVRWLVCSNVCLPGKADVSLNLPVGTRSTPNSATAALFAQARERLPKPLPKAWELAATQTAKEVELTFHAANVKHAEFFPLAADQVEDNGKAAPFNRNGLVHLTLKKSENLRGALKQLRGVLQIEDKAYAVDLALGDTAAAPSEAAPTEAPASSATSPAAAPSTSPALPAPDAPPPAGISNAALALFLAFCGGLILNFMPCVFPVLSIKVLGFVQVGASERGRLRRQGLFYTLGIFVSFWALVAALLILRGAGRHIGWGFQLQSPGFVALLAALMLLFGLNLAGLFEVGYSMMGVGSGLAQREGDTGAFFTGVLATVVATPCTAPFMGTAVGYALAQPAVICVAVFTALAAGLAAPFLLLAFRPEWVRLLPKPGRWMETMKQLFSFPLFATAIWLVWVFGRQTSVDATARLLLLLLGLALGGWVLGHWPGKRKAAIWALVLMIASVAWFSRTDMHAEAKVSATDGQWVPYSEQKLAEARAAGHPVFVDFTASWCMTCQVNERAVLTKSAFLNKVAERNVVLMKADWTSYDPEITKALASFHRSAVPLYVLYDSEASRPASVLPEGILTQQTALDALDRAK